MKIVFCSYLRQKWIALRQTSTKMINGPFYTYHRIHFTSVNASVLWYLFVIIREGRMSQRPSGRAPILVYDVKISIFVSRVDACCSL